MKNSAVRIILFIVCLTIFSVSTGSAAQKRFNLVVREGFGSLKVGDLNTTLESYNNNPYLEGYRQLYPERCLGEFKPLGTHLTGWEAELQAYIWGGFSIGISVSEKAHFSGQSSLLYTIVDYGGTETFNQSFASDIHVSSPIKLNVYYSLKIFAGFRLFVNGGIGFYRARMNQDMEWYYRYPNDQIQVLESSWDVSGSCRGRHFGFGVEYKMNGRISLLAECQWRSAKIDALKGSQTITNKTYDPEGNLISTSTETIEGFLFHYFGEDLDYGGGHEKMLVSESAWDVGIDMPYNIRHAFLDLSSFTFRIGLKIGLF